VVRWDPGPIIHRKKEKLSLTSNQQKNRIGIKIKKSYSIKIFHLNRVLVFLEERLENILILSLMTLTKRHFDSLQERKNLDTSRTKQKLKGLLT